MCQYRGCICSSPAWFILVLLSGTHCPPNWGFQSVLQCLKSVLRFICYLSDVTRNHDHRYLSPCAASNLCCAASGSPYLLCVCALCACSFRWQTCFYARARVFMFTPDLANFYSFYSLIIDFFLSVYWCPFQHGLYECTCTQHTVAHCILS